MTGPKANNNETIAYTKWAPGKTWPLSYRQYVGNKGMWGKQTLDMVGMLTSSGLLESSMLLDVGCGALRAGKMFITFLQRGHYHCVEPNHALVQDAIKLDVGYDLLQRKLPSFAFNEKFTPPPGLPAHFNVDAAASATNATYDFILAQSIFTHTAEDMFLDAIASLRPHMGRTSALLASFFLDDECSSTQCMFANEPGASGWYYGPNDKFIKFDCAPRPSVDAPPVALYPAMRHAASPEPRPVLPRRQRFRRTSSISRRIVERRVRFSPSAALAAPRSRRFLHGSHPHHFRSPPVPFLQPAVSRLSWRRTG